MVRLATMWIGMAGWSIPGSSREEVPVGRNELLHTLMCVPDQEPTMAPERPNANMPP